MKHRQLIGCLNEDTKFKGNKFVNLIPVDVPATALGESAQKILRSVLYWSIGESNPELDEESCMAKRLCIASCS
jgi:hypothetical protein